MEARAKEGARLEELLLRSDGPSADKPNLFPRSADKPNCVPRRANVHAGHVACRPSPSPG